MKPRLFSALRGLLSLCLLLCGVAAIALVIYMTYLIVTAGAWPIGQVGLPEFLFGRVWNPAADSYGITPLVLATLYSLGAAGLLASLPGLLAALLAARLAPQPLRDMLKALFGYMSVVPSLVYGLVALVAIGPYAARWFGLSARHNLLVVVILLSLVMLPRVASGFVRVFETLPVGYEKSALALGATGIEACGTALRHGRRALVAAWLTEVGRISGESLAVMMVAGNIPNMPRLGASIATLSTTISSGADGAGLAQDILYGLALVVFLLALVGVILFRLVSGRRHQP